MRILEVLGVGLDYDAQHDRRILISGASKAIYIEPLCSGKNKSDPGFDY
jgi:hypothetical protein